MSARAARPTGYAGAGLCHAVLPSHLYELLPIAVLIGTIFVMARLAQSSEYTILRTSGLGPWRALRTLLALGLVFTLLTFAAGDYLAPVADRAAQLMKARYQGRISVGQTGAWLKEKQAQHTYNVNVSALTPDGEMAACASSRPTRAASWSSTTQATRASFGDGGLDAERGRAAPSSTPRAPTSREGARTSRRPACAGRPRSAPKWCPWPCSSPTA